ncbi:MAG: Uma2 family endonuclease [Bacteroidales bacterium]|nr:Uma2 family endonuclease [Bacteroidales bacterium]
MELQLDMGKRYTYADYLTWLDDKRRELIDGFIKMMSPSPRFDHAVVSSNIAGYLWTVLKKNKGKCRVFTAPFDVRFPKNGETTDDKIYTVVQPDICVICDLSKLDELGCCGAPDMIVEILSPSTTKKDVNDKFNLYEEHGVKEYWVVHPKDKTVFVFLLQENGRYDDGTLYEGAGKAPVHIFENYLIDLNDIFDY